MVINIHIKKKKKQGVNYKSYVVRNSVITTNGDRRHSFLHENTQYTSTIIFILISTNLTFIRY